MYYNNLQEKKNKNVYWKSLPNQIAQTPKTLKENKIFQVLKCNVFQYNLYHLTSEKKTKKSNRTEYKIVSAAPIKDQK